MAFRYLIYRTDFGNTIVRESVASSATGGTELELFTDFVIPEIQPLYLWRVTGGTDVVPNTDQNIADWLANVNPPSGDDPVTFDIFTGYTAQTQSDLNDKVSFTIFNAYTAQTQSDLDGKIDKVTGATGNVGQFDASGNLIDSGFSISDLTGATATDIFVSGGTLDGSAQLILQRSEGQSDVVIDLSALSGITVNDGVVSGATLNGTILELQRTEGLPDVTVDLATLLTDLETDIATISGDVIQNTTDIATISGDVIQNTTDIQLVSGVTTQNTSDIASISGQTADIEADITFISGETASNDADIAFISGVTNTKQDQLSAGEGINTAALAADTVQVDLSAFTAIGGFNITLTGSTNAVITDLRAIARGLEYAGDYSTNFTVRSLVDKGYVDAVAAGLDLKESVVVATTSGETDIDLTLGTFGGVIDGYTLQDGDRVLIKNQDSTKEDNGIYIWSAGSSTFARAIDFDNPNVTSGAFSFVETGATNGGSGWVLVSQDPINIGTTELTFTQFSSTGSLTAGNGININNGIVSVDGGGLAGNFIQWTGTQFNVTGLTTLTDFNSYTGVTDTRITNIENDIITISGDVIQNTSDIASLSGSSVSNDVFTGYTATTDTRLDGIEDDIAFISGETASNDADITFISGITDTKLDTSIFTGYTASTQSNELFLIHTGGTELNTVIATAIVWNSGVTVGSAYSFTGSTIEILETGEYELTYNIPFNQSGNNSNRGIGGNIVLNNTDVIDVTAAADFTSRSNAAGSVTLGTVNLSLTSGDNLDLVCFRTAQSGSVISSPNGSLLIKKKSTLQ